MRRLLRLGVAATATWLVSAAAAAPAPAATAESPPDHLFDPVLSLEGDCNGDDGVEDPGCPYEPPPAGPRPFELPCGAAVDPHGSVYVANPAEATTNGRIDVFDAQGRFLAEIDDAMEPCQLAVDSAGNLYVVEKRTETVEEEERVFVARFQPGEYPPEPGVEYSLAGKLEFVEREPGKAVDFCAQPKAVAIDPSNDHLYVGKSCHVEEYGSAAEGSPLNTLLNCCIGEGANGVETSLRAIDVYGKNQDVYATNRTNNKPIITSLFVFDGASGATKCELRGTGPEPSEAFDFGIGGAIAVDQASGELFVYDLVHGVVDQFELDGNGGPGCPQYSFARKLPDLDPPPVFGQLNVDVAVDGPCRSGAEPSESCNVGGVYESPNEGEVYITVGGNASNSHLYAFKPRIGGPPEVRAQAAGGIGETEAVLEAELNPHGLDTTYRFEYVTRADFEEDGFAGATPVPVPDAHAGDGGAFAPVSASATGLEPGVAYRFRLVARNCDEREAGGPASCVTLGEGSPGGEGVDAAFATYPAPPGPGPCPNAELRTGPSGALPDCRAYELVSPTDTRGRIPTMGMLGGGFGGGGFATTMASPDGDSLAFGSVGGALPGIGGGGTADTYEAQRGEAGWQSRFTGLSAIQARKPFPAGVSPEHDYAFWSVEGDLGTLSVPETGRGHYLRVPAGTASSPNCAPAAEPEGGFELVGCGSLGFEPKARGKWIAPGGEHVIFTTTTNNAAGLRLEPCAPPFNGGAIYDRTPGGETRCVALLPGDAAPTASATYRGVSADGSVVAFTVAGDDNLYVRRDNAETLVAAAGSPTFGGLSAGGERVFYLDGGDIFACDLDEGGCAGEGSHEPIAVGAGGDSTLVNVSADGSAAYFVSGAVLSGEEENGFGARAEADEENLYAWDGEAVRFIATVSAPDVSGGEGFGGLGLWTSQVLHVNPGLNTGPARDPSRTTPDGAVLVFESSADLTGQAGGARRQVYRYEAGAPAGRRLACLSCVPTGAPAGSDATLEDRGPLLAEIQSLPPVNAITWIANVTADGSKVFFQSSERLVAGDVDGRQDVYEWEADGEGGCRRAAGCTSLISSGRSAHDEYLYAMTADGDDVFFLGADALVPGDLDGIPSIYDARVNGGFPAPLPLGDPCLGELCQPAVEVPVDPVPASSTSRGPGNPVAAGDCSAAARRARRLARRARRVRGAARRVRGARRARRMRRRANRLAARAQRSSRQGKRCRRAKRGRRR